MKKHGAMLSACLLLILTGYTQNVGINADASVPNPNAILDIKSGSKGLLIPRMDAAARNAIPNTKGLLVYDTVSNNFWYNTGTEWQSIATNTLASSLLAASGPWLLTGNAGTSDTAINDGNIAAGNGTVLFTGDAPASSVIGGSRAIRFYGLTLGKPAADLVLDNDAAVGGRLTLDNGNLQLNGHNLDLGSTGSIFGERNEARIMGDEGGTITLTAQLNRPQALNPGNIGLEFTSSANLGTTLITRGHVRQTDASGQTGIRRYYEINPESNAGLQASLRFYYFDGELAGKNKNELAVFSNNGMLGDWVPAGKDGYSATDNWVIKGGIDQLHRYTLSIPGDKQLAATTMTSSASIFPNPSHDAFTLLLTSGKEGRVAVNLFDMTGHVLETKELYLQAGPNTVTWNIDKYPAGVYWVGFAGMRFGSVRVVKQ